MILAKVGDTFSYDSKPRASGDDPCTIAVAAVSAA